MVRIATVNDAEQLEILNNEFIWDTPKTVKSILQSGCDRQTTVKEYAYGTQG